MYKGTPAVKNVGKQVARHIVGERRHRCLLWGGETTVTVTGDGRGGRSQELALAAAIELADSAGVGLLVAGTDGQDGPTDAAGAWVGGGTPPVAGARAALETPKSVWSDGHSSTNSPTNKIGSHSSPRKMALIHT